MAGTSTLSPDSIHGGPAIATLSGIFLNDGDKSCIDRGDIFRIDTGTTPPTFSFKGGSAGNIAIAAEAVTLTHNQLKHSKDGGYLVHIPVVVFGRTMVNCKDDTTTSTTYHGGDMAYIGSDFKVTDTEPTATGYRITFLHPDEIVSKKESPKEVFVEPYRA
jgi:hypothetical protein